MANKIKKSLTEDVFAGFKTIDNKLNEAAGISNKPVLSFEEKMQLKLKESVDVPNSHTAPNVFESEEVLKEDDLEDLKSELGSETDLGSETEVESDVDFDLGDENPEMDVPSDLGLDDEDALGDDEGGFGDDFGASAPAADFGSEPSEGAIEEPADESSEMIAEPENIDTLIMDQLANETSVDPLAETKSELGTEEIVESEDEILAEAASLKTQIEKMTGKKVIFKEYEGKAVKDDLSTGTKVKGSEAPAKGLKHIGGVKVVQAAKGHNFTVLDTEDITGSKVADSTKAKITQPGFDKVKAESVKKSKALYNLAEKHVALNEAHEALKFKYYKAVKSNGVLTLLPELKQVTREKLVQKFDECVDYTQVRKLYNELTEMVRNNKRPSLNEMVTKHNKSAKYLGEGTSAPEAGVSPEQARKDFLMGLTSDDNYGENLGA